MPKLGIIVSSNRPNRVGEHVGSWVREHVGESWEVDEIDLAAQGLPFFDGASSPKQGLPRTEQHAIDWAERVAALDAVVIATPEYNGAYPAILKNAIDFLYEEWSGLPIVLVGYGWGGAAGSIELLERLFARVGANVVGSVGLHFREDLTVEGAVSVREQVELELTDLIGALETAVAQRHVELMEGAQG
ncbi:NAD(P)H-dependent oxidoreductase [Brachybacterium sp. JHP9]|uniref:NAD(P)H-dependent oxidoreductase n=1 Tax=Brachybacterium equifaecis TaxID=2910770 RepID=A0ABT0R120_9MICO|nr:NAD(P)H-dependent oxidoreductase [Brachybacterium equifaecis]MCL6423615.1 NAD(P)H-dependent oxidoreductase [Brachybacterium equifaecis]